MSGLHRFMTPRGQRTALASLGLLLALATAGCEQAPGVWKPVLEGTSTTSLRAETQKAAEHLQKARALMTSVPADAEAELESTEVALRHLLGYYLPLVEARERSYNACRHFYLGDKRSTTRELDEIEKILVEMGSDGAHLARELEEPLADLAAAKDALARDTGDAPEQLTTLATKLNFLVVKGGLVLHPGGPDSP